MVVVLSHKPKTISTLLGLRKGKFCRLQFQKPFKYSSLRQRPLREGLSTSFDPQYITLCKGVLKYNTRTRVMTRDGAQ